MQDAIPTLDLRMLGPLEVRHRGRPVAAGGPQARLVLARLLVDRGRVVPVDRLEETLWAEAPPDASAVTLRAYVSRLRRVLGSGSESHTLDDGTGALIRAVGTGYVLDVGADSVDADRFERAAGDGREALRTGEAEVAAARLRAALGEWRGPVLADLHEQPFVVGAAARLDGIRLTAMEDLFEAELALGRHLAILPDLEEHARSAGSRERAWALLMLALYRAGRQADALAAFREVRRRLVAELGVEPGPELQALQGAILRHEVPGQEGRAARRRAAIPSPQTSFVGRVAELAQIADALDRARIVTLTGLGGSGKTRLAFEHAARLDHEGGEVVVAELASLPRDAPEADVAAVVAAAAEIELRPPGRPETLVATALGRAGGLVVLDNCEHVLDGAAALAARVVAAGATARILATSREPLRAQGETVLPVAPLPVAEAGQPARPGDDAVVLFRERARTARAGAEIGPAELVAEICRRLDGLPLALELAAARLETLSLTQLAERLEERLRFLRAWSRHAPTRQQTLGATMDWSFDLLDEPARRVLIRLGVFRSAFGLDDVTAVSGEPATVAADALERLVRASLVTPKSDGEVVHYRLLETVRAYALERLAASEDRLAATRAHAALMLDHAERLRATRTTPAESAAFDRLESLHDDLRVALELLLGREPGMAGVRLAAALGPFWRLRGYLDEGIRWHRRALEVVRTAPDEPSSALLRATLLGQLGALLGRASVLAEAEPLLREAVAEADRAGDPRSHGEWLHMLAFVLRRRGALDEATEIDVEAARIQREIGDLGGLAWSLGSLADLATLQGEFERADARYREGSVIVAAAGDPPGLVVAYLESRARLALLRGDRPAAQELADRALAEARRLGDLWHVGLATVLLADLRRAAGEPGGAAALARASIDAFGRLGDLGGQAEAVEALGGALADVDRDEDAARLLGAAAAAREAWQVPLAGPAAAGLEADARIVRARLGDAAFDAAFGMGRLLGVEAALRTVPP